MTDEELAICLTRIAGNGLEWFSARSCRLCQEQHGGKCPTGESETCIVPYSADIGDWLKAQAEN